MKKILLFLLLLSFIACSDDNDGNEEDYKFSSESLGGTTWVNNDHDYPITLQFQKDSFCIFIVKETIYIDTLYYFYKFENPKLYLNTNNEMNIGYRPSLNGNVSKNRIDAENEYGEPMIFNLKP